MRKTVILKAAARVRGPEPLLKEWASGLPLAGPSVHTGPEGLDRAESVEDYRAHWRRSVGGADLDRIALVRL